MPHKETLLLDSSFQPLEIIDWQRSISLLMSSDKVEVIEEYQDILIRSPTISVKLPAVMRIKHPIKRGHWKKYRRSFFSLKPNKKSIYTRDKGRCVYCNKDLNFKEATLDHIVPRSKGGQNTWENLVCCCKNCNHSKGSKKRETVYPNADLSTISNANVDRIQVIEQAIKNRSANMPTQWLFYFSKT